MVCKLCGLLIIWIILLEIKPKYSGRNHHSDYGRGETITVIMVEGKPSQWLWSRGNHHSDYGRGETITVIMVEGKPSQWLWSRRNHHSDYGRGETITVIMVQGKPLDYLGLGGGFTSDLHLGRLSSRIIHILITYLRAQFSPNNILKVKGDLKLHNFHFSGEKLCQFLTGSKPWWWLI